MAVGFQDVATGFWLGSGGSGAEIERDMQEPTYFFLGGEDTFIRMPMQPLLNVILGLEIGKVHPQELCG